MICYLRENETTQESSFQSLCKAASLQWSGWFAFSASGRIFLVLLLLLVESKRVAVHGQEMGCGNRLYRTTCPTDPPQDSSLTRPGPQLNSGFPSVPVLQNLRKERGKKKD